MDLDLKFLLYLATHPNVSQRQLAKEMGISLGSVNAQMKSLMERHWLDVKNGSTNTVQYILTEVGCLEKEKRYLEYVSDCFLQITEFKEMIKENIIEKINQGTKKFLLYGEEDIIYKLIKMCLMEMKREHAIDFQKTQMILKESNSLDTGVLYWDPKLEVNYQNAFCIIRKSEQ